MVDFKDAIIDRSEQDKIWEAFMAHDFENQGFISVNDLKFALNLAGE